MGDELFRSAERREAERVEAERIRRHNQTNLKALLLTLAIVIAPFLALMISLDAALAVLAAALAFTTWLTWKVAGDVGPVQGSRLRIMAMLNLALTLLVLLVLAIRLAG
jgi:hypothetical protein